MTIPGMKNRLPGMNIMGGLPPPPPDEEMTITKCRPTKVQCSHRPGPSSLRHKTKHWAYVIAATQKTM